MYTKYSRIKVSAAFQVIVFETNNSTIKVAPYLCRCEQCLCGKYVLCVLFTEIKLCFQGENVAADDQNYDNNTRFLACSINIRAIVTDKSSADNGWFSLIIDKDCCNHTEEFEDAYDDIVPVSQSFLKVITWKDTMKLKKALSLRDIKMRFSYRKKVLFTHQWK